ncbi:hypothetical protein HK097_001040 [Rhizophlyctis rosea]|uniref:D-xylose 1-dehydrogenase (NADP(+), D-xylono-1,5-lactone-forming) n=1 Tax=Rhizophlyctis rosea TaxID=64517 RepID=A0AAD5X8P4_9FUNG|nr:hypothetical protein HK097_001040 [Rhizophlyctis rosea]
MTDSPRKLCRWGIIGLGGISTKFATSIIRDNQSTDPETPKHAIVAVGSSSLEKAQSFVDKIYKGRPEPFSGSLYGSYEDLVADPNIDIIYIGTPHQRHHDDTLLCLRAGKHVLVEKPFAVNAQEAQEMAAVAEGRGLFLMEALWTRYLPAAVKVRELLDKGILGDIRHVVADLCRPANTTGENKSEKHLARKSLPIISPVPFNADPAHRFLNPDLAGGALLDLGIYPLQWLQFILGPLNGDKDPQVSAHIEKHPLTGVDGVTSAVLHYTEAKALATFTTSIEYFGSDHVTLYGTQGVLRILGPNWAPTSVVFTSGTNNDGKEEVFDCSYEGNGMRFEADEAARCVLGGRLESLSARVQESVLMARVMDGIRRQGGVKYPFEVEIGKTVP